VADLGDISSFFSSITNDFSTAFKTVNAPTTTPVAGSAVPGRPGYVYGPGGSIQAISPASGLPVVNSVPATGTNWSIVLLIGAGVALLLAFALSVGRAGK